jgi:hypothetical protein
MNLYEEIVHIPLFIHDPRKPGAGRTTRLTQSIDIAPTFLDLYGVEPPVEAEGRSLLQDGNREAAIFGYFGGAVNVTDGRYTYHRFPEDIRTQEVYQYTVMPAHLKQLFTPEELSGATLADPFGWTKRVPLLKVPVIERSPMYNNYGPGSLLEKETRLYDLEADPGQEKPLNNPAVEARMVGLMRGLMARNEAPVESYSRLALESA